jgi:hypothetical protein
MRRGVQRMPKSREKSTRKTHNMTKIREKKKCRAERIAEKAKGLRPNNTLSDHRSTEPCTFGLKNRSAWTIHTGS